jgi:hypothetical protein
VGHAFHAWQRKRARERQFFYDNVRIRPDLVKVWLDANSLSASERSRQLYAQELHDARAARRIDWEQERLAREKAEGMVANTPPPPDYSPWAKTRVKRKWPAAPVYTPHDYPLILKLSEADDLPATWEEWWANFKASEAEQRHQGLFATRVRVHAGKFKAWLQANSLSSSQLTRQQYAQQRLDWKRARRVAQRAAERLPWAERMQLFAEAPALPSPWPHRVIEVLAYVILAVAIGSLLIALLDGWHAWVMRDLPDWPLT